MKDARSAGLIRLVRSRPFFLLSVLSPVPLSLLACCIPPQPFSFCPHLSFIVACSPGSLVACSLRAKQQYLPCAPLSSSYARQSHRRKRTEQSARLRMSSTRGRGQASYVNP
ncbi:hypothetical protein BJY59DRAFT_437916 [Rhodotorula toruloides]